MLKLYGRFPILKSNIARKFILYILIFSSFITLILTLIQLYIDYQNGIDSIETSINQIEVSYLESINKSLWNFNIPLLKIQLEGMLKLADMQYIQIIENNKIVAKAGTFQNSYIIDKTFVLLSGYSDQSAPLAELYVAYSLKGLYKRLLNKVVVIIIAQSIKTFLVSIFLFFIFYMMIGRHLIVISNYLRFFSFDNIDNPLIIKNLNCANEKDELVQFVISFNKMRKNLIYSINERQKVEERLRKTRSYLNNVVNSMPSILIGVDPDGRITQWNHEAEKKTGISFYEAEKKIITEIFPDMKMEMANIKKIIKERKSLKNEKFMHNIQGRTYYSDITMYPLITNGVDGAVIRVDDVTERVRMEEIMIQSEKMMSVGGLAAGMAHEINNPLAGILQNIQVIHNRISDNLPKNISTAIECGTTIEAIKDYMTKRKIFSMIDGVMESGQRAAAIVNNMLSFSRKSDSKFTPNDLCQLMDKTVELASNDYDLKKKYDFRKVQIIRDYNPSMPKVLCEPGKIQQVFLNILKNGAQAMMGQKNKNRDPCFILRISCHKNMAVIEIQDNGPGIHENIRSHIFEPFFTTKKVGIGTGLGLSVSYFIITNNHRGTIHVESNSDHSTKFIIKLPLK